MAEVKTTPTPIVFALASSGAFTADGSETNPLIKATLTPTIFLGTNIEAKLILKPLKSNVTSLEHLQMTVTIIDGDNDDEIVTVSGSLTDDEEKINSFLFNAYASNFFNNDDLEYTLSGSENDIIKAVQASTAYNSYGSRSKNNLIVKVPDDEQPAFNADTTSNLLKNLPQKPSDIGLTGFGSDEMPITVLEPLLDSLYDLNIPIILELPSTSSLAEAIALSNAIDLNNMQVSYLFSPNVARPVGASSLIGKKTPYYALGQFLAFKFLRNQNVSAKGIPPLATAVAGKDFPFEATGLAVRSDIVYDKDSLEDLAVAKINVVRPIDFDNGTRFVLSDGLTTYKSETSALRLHNASECAMYTSNQVIKKLASLLPREGEDYKTKASKLVDDFLSSCFSAGVIQRAENLDNRPYTFKLEYDPQKPFERVLFELDRGLPRCIRSVRFASDAVSK